MLGEHHMIWNLSSLASCWTEAVCSEEELYFSRSFLLSADQTYKLTSGIAVLYYLLEIEE